MPTARTGFLSLTAWKLQDIAARAAQAAVLSTSPSTARLFARSLGDLLWRLLPKRSRIARRSATRVLGSRGDRVAQRSFGHVLEMIVQTMWFRRRLHAANWRRSVEIVGAEHLDSALALGRGVVALGGHFGNWEAFPRVMSLQGRRVHVVRRRMDNPVLNATFERFWKERDSRVIWRDGAMREGLRALKNGDIVVLYTDQDAHRQGIFVPFLGLPASTIRGPALLSLRSGAPLVSFTVTNLEDGRCRIAIEEGFQVDVRKETEEAIGDATRRFTAQLERRILLAPDQWMWIHRRWKTKQPGVESQPAATSV